MQNIDINKLVLNTGQLDGLPRNPRFIRDEKYEALKRNIADYPELLQYRGLLVYPHDGKYIVIGGNMRLRAMRDLRFKDAPCAVLPADTPVETLRAYVILDNNGFGQWDWDLIANEWDMQDIGSWGMDTPIDFEDGGDDDVDGDDDADHPSVSLADTFLIPPMSVIQTAGEAWKERAAWWKERSHDDDADRLVLADIILRWFTPTPHPAVLSPLDDDPAVRAVTETTGGTYTTGTSIPAGTQDIIIADISGQPTTVADTLAQATTSLRPCRFAVIVDAYETPTASDAVKDTFAARDIRLLNELVVTEPTGDGTDDYTKIFVFYNDDPRRISKLYPKVEGVDAAVRQLTTEDTGNG